MVLAPPLLVGCPPTSVPNAGKRRQKPKLVRAHFVSQAGEKGYGNHNWDVWGVSGTVGTCWNLLHSGTVHALSQRNWPWFVGHSEESSFMGSQEVMGIGPYLLIAWWLLHSHHVNLQITDPSPISLSTSGTPTSLGACRSTNMPTFWVTDCSSTVPSMALTKEGSCNLQACAVEGPCDNDLLPFWQTQVLP